MISKDQGRLHWDKPVDHQDNTGCELKGNMQEALKSVWGIKDMILKGLIGCSDEKEMRHVERRGSERTPHTQRNCCSVTLYYRAIRWMHGSDTDQIHISERSFWIKGGDEKKVIPILFIHGKQKVSPS